jgi:hypothetical protein
VSVESLRYCDLCGSTMQADSAKLAVPIPPERATTEQLMQASRMGGQLVRWYDVCDGCLQPMLANVRVHEERARVELERRRLEQLHEQGQRWIGGGPLIVER